MKRRKRPLLVKLGIAVFGVPAAMCAVPAVALGLLAWSVDATWRAACGPLDEKGTPPARR